MRPYYITTPIYYVNGEPHIGHAYTTIAADLLARFHRMRGRPTRFLTGTDEHGQKIERKASEQGLDPQAFVDRLIPSFHEAWKAIGCEPDDFIRTTEKRHEVVVDELWKRCLASGDIYLGHYEGWYSVIDEAFFTEKDIENGKVKETGNPVEWVKEPGYFFRLSKYTDKLLAFFEAHPDFVRPEGKFNEVKAFVKQGLEDLNISRTTFRWGLPVPGAPDHVVYVWFDALTNYISALGGFGVNGGAPGALYAKHWEPNGEAVHLIGKEITRFHCIYWPAFLMSAGLPLPTQVFAHGWMTVNNAKMSKSAGNFLPPAPIAEAIGKDALRYYLMRDVALGSDSDFSHASLLARYHGDLGNGLGNLLNRMVASIVRTSFEGRVPHVSHDRLGELEKSVIATAERSAESAAKFFADIAPHRALEAIWELVGVTNKYVDQTEPWALAKKGETARLEVVAYTVLESLRWLSLMLWPVMPSKCDELRAQLGLPPVAPTEGLDRWPSAWGGLVAGMQTKPGAPLFPRLDDDQQRAFYLRLGAPVPAALEKKVEPKKAEPKTDKATKAQDAKKETKVTTSTTSDAGTGLITIDQLSAVDMRLGLVKSAERVAGSDKLLELKVDIGEPEPRTILAGIAEHYAPEALVGRRITVVANLAPRTFAKFGKTSHGMVLAVKDASGLSVLSPDKDITPGVKVS
jgi:methionyl-tRNA synthetase